MMAMTNSAIRATFVIAACTVGSGAGCFPEATPAYLRGPEHFGRSRQLASWKRSMKKKNRRKKR